MATITDLAPNNTLSFHAALLQAEAQARSTLDVALHERLSAAVALVKNGRVFQTSTGDWQVDSTTRTGLAYTVNGTCICDDHHFNKPRYCKHQLAMFLSQRVCTLMRQPSQPVVPVKPFPNNDSEPTPQAPPVERAPASPALPPALPAAPEVLPEMPLSLTLKGTMGGVDALLTVRGRTAAEFHENLQAIRDLLDKPARSDPSVPAPPAPLAPQEPREDWCATHAAQMTLRTNKKDHSTFYSHRKPDGEFCKGKG